MTSFDIVALLAQLYTFKQYASLEWIIEKCIPVTLIHQCKSSVDGRGSKGHFTGGKRPFHSWGEIGLISKTYVKNYLK